MCLIALAHGASERFPLVIAANRDEDHQRATRYADFWEDAPDVVGGRDVLKGGSWLAVSRGGRFAAVTNLHGAVQRTRSRGLLVSAFVTSSTTPDTFADEVARSASEYAGFHLLAGEIGGTVMYVAGSRAQALEHGIYGFSNARENEHWPKVDYAVSAMEEVLANAEDARKLSTELLRFLRTPRNRGVVQEEVFIAGDRYGTRCSTVVIATADEILFTEQNYSSGGVAAGEARQFFFSRSAGGWTSRV